ncbi:Serine/threonine protein kinase [Handroanthus impetiginosus]|uniref:Receptor-like serine/threonine-protein kinase n=1 Tax=Handroanthus impetiginosus TaxID=429701 RepID=A0A2G9HFW2_9LAMI|nr:Serine/threonine protein kinase [Handroanthus impetiginosus]
MKRSNEDFTFLLVFTFLLTFSTALDVINTTQIITDDETLISLDGSFELGFFSPGNSKNRYVGIWYKKITDFTVVWVANRDNPLKNTSGIVLRVISPGIIALMNNSNGIIWSSNTSRVAQTPVAQLLDSGNLVVRESNDYNSDNYLWQSFDYPTDTLLPGMKLGKNFITGHEIYISAWKSNEDPGTADYTYHLDPTGYPQAIFRKGSIELSRSGPWNGVGYSGFTGLKENTIYTFEVVFDNNEVYYHYELLNKSVVSRIVLNQSGVGQRWTWVEQKKGWVMYLTGPLDNCDSYKQCGAYGICNVGTSPICGCLTKFIPRYPQEWVATDWSHGCVRKTQLDCKSDGFLKYFDIKLPDTKHSWFDTSMTLEECKLVCLKNCSCMAYTNLDIRRGGSGCLLWFGELDDIKQVYGAGQDIYIRVASSELDSRSKKRAKELIASLTSLGVSLLSISVILYICKRKKEEWHKESHNKDLNLPSFDLSTISKATNNFSLENKLGEGGFGPVYKGTLEDRQEIAVKRLSKTSTQGHDEFKNEVIFIAKLQHRNLVKLLGCCIQEQEKMLIYEYMPNKSLDQILFDETKSNVLDWCKRFSIIGGIARGLMYLHQDSRLRIVHRDLKASNILLDIDMNPKISDFGMARTFVGNETEANTNKVAGTYGYMSPEYAIDGLFSIKSDVFSFGVIVLEILSGKRNRRFSHKDHDHNLLGHAWMLYKEGKSLELVKDINLGENSYDWSEIIRTIQVGLLCVQKYPEDRPSMSSVVFMLENEVLLPQPKQPGFFIERYILANDTSTSTKASSANEITITMPEGR